MDQALRGKRLTGFAPQNGSRRQQEWERSGGTSNILPYPWEVADTHLCLGLEYGRALAAGSVVAALWAMSIQVGTSPRQLPS